MSDDLEKTQTGISASSTPAKANASAAGAAGTFSAKKAVIAVAGLVGTLGMLFAFSQLKKTKTAKQPSADEKTIMQREGKKKGEAQEKVNSIEQAPLGKDGVFDEAGNFARPKDTTVELPENKTQGKGGGLSGKNESEIDKLALDSGHEQKPIQDFTQSNRGRGGSPVDTQDPSMVHEVRQGQKEERELLEASNLGYSRTKALAETAGPNNANRARVLSPTEEAEAKLEALRASASRGPVTGGGGAAGNAGPGGEYIAAAPGTGRSFTRPGEVADMRVHRGEFRKVPEGKSIECVMVNQVLAQASQSPVIVTVSRPFYSADGRLLIPTGVRIVGIANRIEDMNQERMFMAFNRIDYAEGWTAWFPEHRIPEALDSLGSMGVEGKVRRGIMKALFSSIALGVVEGLGAAAAGPMNISTTTGITEVKPGQMAAARVSDQLGKFSDRVLSRYMNMVPQVTLRPGQRLRIYFSEDTLMSVYK